MYQIPFGSSIMLVDCTWKSYDPDKFEIHSMEWEVGITIPRCVWWNLMIDLPRREFYWQLGSRCYIHEYIFVYMCAYEPLEYYTEY